MQVQVLRAISGLDAAPGDIVDTRGWAANRVEQLIRQRRVTVVVPAVDMKGKGRRHEEDFAR